MDQGTIGDMEEKENPDGDKSEFAGLVVEAIASMIYIFVCGGVVCSTETVTFGELNSPRMVVIALAQGFAYASLIYLTQVIGKYGNGYLNPAITFAIALTTSTHGRFQWGNKPGSDWKRAVYLIIAQTFGGIMGSVLILATIPNASNGNRALGIPHIDNGATYATAFVFESFSTFFYTW